MKIPKKICTFCKLEKPLYEFTKNIKSFDKLERRCKECLKKNHKPSELERLRRDNPEVYPSKLLF